MSSPIVIHVLRPYASEEEYLASEAASISAKSMLLIDQPALPVETPVVFDVSLSNGQRPIRAEGVVLSYVEPSAERAGGLRVRFKRYGAATKAFIQRAVDSAAPVPPPAQVQARVAEPSPEAAPALVSAAPADRTQPDPSGVHRKAVQPVTAPANREALLERLRARRTG